MRWLRGASINGTDFVPRTIEGFKAVVFDEVVDEETGGEAIANVQKTGLSGLLGYARRCTQAMGPVVAFVMFSRDTR